MRTGLAERYGQDRLPRYTSYPTAPHFSKVIDENCYRAWLGGMGRHDTASLYLHVPFCRSMCWYCGCHTSVTKRDEPIAVYQAAMRREIGMVAEALPHRTKVAHVHFGGGTPTIMTPALFTDLVATLRSCFFVLPDAELAVEIDPRTLTLPMVDALGYAGITRASLGVQSFDPAVQRAINRIQTFEQTAAATHNLRRAGVNAINFDLIYGLPLQSIESCVETVRQSVALRPDRLSVFGYAHVPSFKKHQRRISEADLPGSMERHRQAEAIAGALQQEGYVRIGLDHFALPVDPLAIAQRSGHLHRNFQGYTDDRADVLLGFGASAIGRFRQGYVQNSVPTRDYLERIAKGRLATVTGYTLTSDDHFRAEIIERLMCDFVVDLDDVCHRYGLLPASLWPEVERLSPLLSDGVVAMKNGKLKVEDDSRFLVRTVASAFDAHIGRSAAVHSRAV